MTRDSFIKKWLGNPDYKYSEENRDAMRDDLDLVIGENALTIGERMFLHDILIKKKLEKNSNGLYVILHNPLQYKMLTDKDYERQLKNEADYWINKKGW